MTDVKHKWPWTVVISESGAIHNLEYETEDAARGAYDKVQQAITDAADFRNDRKMLIVVSDVLGEVAIGTVALRSVRIVNSEMFTQEHDRLGVERAAAHKVAVDDLIEHKRSV